MVKTGYWVELLISLTDLLVRGIFILLKGIKDALFNWETTLVYIAVLSIVVAATDLEDYAHPEKPDWPATSWLDSSWSRYCLHIGMEEAALNNDCANNLMF